ncbi:MAG TPA: addiction module protein [Thermoanaerobaculia bacterium]|nr:addiction module protein [Thermoanaerobaculia bacterium]
MGKASALNVADLSRDEKLELLDRLLGKPGPRPGSLPLTNSQREELDRRLDELEAEGPTGLSWDEVVARARAREMLAELARTPSMASSEPDRPASAHLRAGP